MESYSSEISTALAGVTWPPPSTEQLPVYEFKLNHAMIRARSLGLYVYQPNFWWRKLEISEHGLLGLRLKADAAYLPWSDIKTITLASKRRQVCVHYGRTTFVFNREVAQITSLEQGGFDLLGVAIKRYARCVVVEDDKIFWSYSKLMVWYSLFWLCELSLLLSTHHLGQWTGFWGRILGLLNHLVAINLL